MQNYHTDVPDLGNLSVDYNYTYRLKESLFDKQILGVEFVTVSKHDGLRFHTDFGPVIWMVQADCCSKTWIETADLDCHGVVTGVEENPLPSQADLPEESEGDHCQYYGITIRTNKGAYQIDFRNESNRYYGGSMVVAQCDRWLGLQAPESSEIPGIG